MHLMYLDLVLCKFVFVINAFGCIHYNNHYMWYHVIVIIQILYLIDFMSKFVKDILLMHVSNVSVIDVFVSIINVFERFYVKVWQDARCKMSRWWMVVMHSMYLVAKDDDRHMFSVHNKTSIASNSSGNMMALAQ